MTEREKRIEEMAMLSCRLGGCNKCPIKGRQCMIYNNCLNLYDAGYRKADEVRKETASEIFVELLESFPKESDVFQISRQTVKLVASRYGVEVEE